MSVQWITAVYHVWKMDVIVTVIQTVQTMKMRLNAVSLCSDGSIPVQLALV